MCWMIPKGERGEGLISLFLTIVYNSHFIIYYYDDDDGDDDDYYCFSDYLPSGDLINSFKS